MTAADVLGGRLDAARPIGLGDLVERAELQTRVDRKYLLDLDVLARVLDNLSDRLLVLDIDGRRLHGYRSTYFDTPDLTCYRGHVQGRRHRFKVRTRTYTDSAACMLEVKSSGRRGATQKVRCEYPVAEAATLTADGRGFVAATLGDPLLAAGLVPALQVDYRRATLLDPDSDMRITCDVDLRYTRGPRQWAGRAANVVVETKSTGPSGVIDRELRRHHVRTASLSKYCVGVALLHGDVITNPWHRVLRREFDWPG